MFREAFLNPKYSKTHFSKKKKSSRPETEDFHHLQAILKASFSKKAQK